MPHPFDQLDTTTLPTPICCGDAVIEVVRPSNWTTPFIFASPHSGRRYTQKFLHQSQVPLTTLRQSEDSYVDLLFDYAPHLGAPLLKALFPRVFVDVNRGRQEIDPAMCQDICNIYTPSRRALSGFGVIPRCASNGMPIYGHPLPASEIQMRLEAFYDLYHTALRTLIADAKARFGFAIIIDCHSMPLHPFGPNTRTKTRHDIVLGDRYGSSCTTALLCLCDTLFTQFGYSVAHNTPYAGGYTTAHYGKPVNNTHVLQIEINRTLYLNEMNVTRHTGFDALQCNLRALMEKLIHGLDAVTLTETAAE